MRNTKNLLKTQSRYNRGCLSPISYMVFQWAAQGSSGKKWVDKLFDYVVVMKTKYILCYMSTKLFFGIP